MTAHCTDGAASDLDKVTADIAGTQVELAATRRHFLATEPGLRRDRIQHIALIERVGSNRRSPNDRSGWPRSTQD